MRGRRPASGRRRPIPSCRTRESSTQTGATGWPTRTTRPSGTGFWPTWANRRNSTFSSPSIRSAWQGAWSPKSAQACNERQGRRTNSPRNEEDAPSDAPRCARSRTQARLTWSGSGDMNPSPSAGELEPARTYSDPQVRAWCLLRPARSPENSSLLEPTRTFSSHSTATGPWGWSMPFERPLLTAPSLDPTYFRAQKMKGGSIETPPQINGKL